MPQPIRFSISPQQGFPLAPSHKILAPVAGVRWNAAASDGNYAFSADLLNAKTSGKTTAGHIIACANTSNASGYFEIVVTAVGGNMVIGLTSASRATSDFIGDTEDLGYGADGNIYHHLGGILATYSTYTTGDVISVCRKGNFAYFAKNGVWQNSADPSAGTGGIDVSAYASSVLFPAVSTINSALDVTARFAPSGFAYAIPTGVTAWDTSSVVTISVNPSTGHLVFTGYLPTVTLTTNVSPATGHLTFGGKVPSVSINFAVSPSTGHLVFTGYTPAVVPGVNINPATGHLTFGGHVPSLALTTAVSPTTGHLSFGGKVPSVALTVNVFPATGHLVFAGHTPSLTLGITPTTGHLVFTGYVPDVTGTVVASSALPLKVQYRHRSRNC